MGASHDEHRGDEVDGITFQVKPDEAAEPPQRATAMLKVPAGSPHPEINVAVFDHRAISAASPPWSDGRRALTARQVSRRRSNRCFLRSELLRCCC